MRDIINKCYEDKTQLEEITRKYDFHKKKLDDMLVDYKKSMDKLAESSGNPDSYKKNLAEFESIVRNCMYESEILAQLSTNYRDLVKDFDKCYEFVSLQAKIIA